MRAGKKPVLTGKNAGYAVGAAAIADILANFLAPEYVGLFASIGRFLIGE